MLHRGSEVKKRLIITAFKMELQNWVGSMHDNMMEVMDVAEAKEGTLMKLDIRNVTRNCDGLQRNGQETVPGAHFMHQRRSELRMQP